MRCVPWVALLALCFVCLWSTRAAPEIELVVARYAEDVSWIDEAPFDRFQHVRVYDKNDRGRACKAPARARVVPLPNVGRDAHTYLHHIVENYDRLADVTVFVVGSAGANEKKWFKARWVASRALETGQSAFPDERLPRSLQEDMGDFVIDSYRSSDKANARSNPESELLPCPERPFGAWLHANRLPRVDGVTYQCIFAVTSKHIRQRPRSFYRRLLSYVDHHSSPEAVHYLERSWLAVFHPIERECRLSQSEESNLGSVQ